MTNAIDPVGSNHIDDTGDQYVTMIVADQLFGIPVIDVHDVLSVRKTTPVPLAPDEVAGALNLRGRIVTVVDVRTRLGLPPRDRGADAMCVVVEHKGEPYSLMIDAVGEVMTLPLDSFERNPPTLDPRWREVSSSICQLDGRLLVMLDIDRLMDFVQPQAA